MDRSNKFNSSTSSLPSIHNDSSIQFIDESHGLFLDSASSIESNDNNNINLTEYSNAHPLLPYAVDEEANKTFENVNQNPHNMTIPFTSEQSAIVVLSDNSIHAQTGNDISSQYDALVESQLFFVEGAEEIYQNIGLETLKVISELPTAELRRPLMSIVTKYVSRLEMKDLLNAERDVTKKEWTAARKHSRFPGTGQPVISKPKYFRKKLNEETVADFLCWLHANDYVQNVAFGQKVVSYCNGVHTSIEAVKLTANQRQLVREFAKEWQENDEAIASISESTSGDNDTSESESRRPVQEEDMDILDSEGRCCHTCPKSRTQCFREQGHEGRHSFTPKGRLSPSTIEKLLSSMSAGKIKSLAGLDDTDAITGYENFENMRSLVRTLNNVARFVDSNAAKDLIFSINSVEQFHKIGFPRHLGQGEM